MIAITTKSSMSVKPRPERASAWESPAIRYGVGIRTLKNVHEIRPERVRHAQGNWCRPGPFEVR